MTTVKKMTSPDSPKPNADPEAFEVLTLDFKDPNIVEFTPQYLGILHPFVLKTMTQEQIAASGIVFEGIKA